MNQDLFSCLKLKLHLTAGNTHCRQFRAMKIKDQELRRCGRKKKKHKIWGVLEEYNAVYRAKTIL